MVLEVKEGGRMEGYEMNAGVNGPSVFSATLAVQSTSAPDGRTSIPGRQSSWEIPERVAARLA